MDENKNELIETMYLEVYVLSSHGLLLQEPYGEIINVILKHISLHTLDIILREMAL